MQVLSTNTAKPVTIRWKDKPQTTGIYKIPQPEGIYLTPEGVKGDTIGNPKVHGDRLKACYLFSTGEYPHWKERYPHLDWGFGIFGENLSVEGLDETTLLIGSEYQVGEAHIRITSPREPCFKLGIRFGDQGIIDRFVGHGKPGAYAEVLSPGHVRPGDTLSLVRFPENSMSIAAFFRMLYSPVKDRDLLEKALELPVLSTDSSKKIRRWLKE
ncbi:MOSC domain-containing protein [Robiginitalea sediminis]|uniref:MOSC domain-containing protein n=1 Tax=Robiginitalea sediminis TaxID=1982593 RepID=UPI000B4B27E8|nr:MOSC domain-containing protein [Robiginitalea sediminis]